MDRSGSRRQRRGWLGWSINNGLRLWLWYLILTIAFRCPASPAHLTTDSPAACRHYFNAKDRFLPVVQPYYTAYAAPYVDAARPYHDALFDSVLQPSYVFATSNYRKYAASHVEQAYTVGQDTWKRSVKPQLDSASVQLSDAYERSLGPYVGQVYQAAKPHIDTIQKISFTQYHAILVPTYERAQPYAKAAYDQSYKITSEVVLPYGLWAGETAVTFLQRRVWPPIRILYGENIQPQLAKIQERLSSYKDGKRLESVVESVEATLSSSSAKASSKSLASAPVSNGETSTPSSKASVPKSKAPAQQAAEIEDYTGELRAWKEKFSKAAERGAADLRSRITDITDKQVEQQAKGTGDALLSSLDEVTMLVLEQLKPEVIKVIQDLDLDAEEEAPTEEAVEAAKETTRNAVRAAGKRIKEAAQRLRAWRKKYNEDTETLVNAATNSTLEVVDNIRDLGLQEIGMRWATLDGVSYKDWSEYHDMRKSFADWRSTVQEVVDKHPGPKLANAAGEDVESRGMTIAENAAKELARLKDVALWKVEALDSGDDFSTRYSPPGAARAAQKAKQKVLSASSEYLGSSSSASGVESVVSEASSLIKPASEKASSIAADASAKVSSAADAAAGKASEAASSVSSTVSSAADYASSDASKTSSSAAKRASESAKPKSRSSMSSEASSEASSSVSAASKSASSAASSLSSRISSDVSSASDAASSGINSASSSASSQSRSRSKSKSKSSSNQNPAQEMASSIQARLRSERAAASANDPAAVRAQESMRKRVEALRDSSNEKAAKVVSLAPNASKSASAAASAASSAASSKMSSASDGAASSQSSRVREREAGSAASDVSSGASAASSSLASEASEASSKLEL